MLFGSFGKSSVYPIAVDFGVSRLKVVQLQPGEEGKPATLLSASSRATPPELMDLPAQRLDHQTKQLQEILKSGSFKGRKAVCNVPCAHTFVQHLQVQKDANKPIEQSVGDELKTITGREPGQYILRTLDVAEVTRGGQKRAEVICFAMPREAVIAYMKALHQCRLDVIGVHAEHLAIVKVLESLARTGDGANGAALLVDIGHGSTKLAVSHAGALKIAKVVSIAGRQLFPPARAEAEASRSGKEVLRAQLAALEQADTDHMTAVLESPPVATASPTATSVSQGALETLADEVQQAVRYHSAIFPDKKIERVVFVGGESRRLEICKRIARALGLPAQIADPLSAIEKSAGAKLDGVESDGPTSAWAVALGLCRLPTEA